VPHRVVRRVARCQCRNPGAAPADDRPQRLRCSSTCRSGCARWLAPAPTLPANRAAAPRCGSGWSNRCYEPLVISHSLHSLTPLHRHISCRRF
jgi:hypothetical protein